MNKIRLKQIEEGEITDFVNDQIAEEFPSLLYSYNPVFTTGEQSITAQKTFTISPVVPTAVLANQAVRLNQLNNVQSNLQFQIDAIDTSLANDAISGFAGVVSLNGITGRVFMHGLNGISVYQEGSNIIRISGESLLDNSGVSGMFIKGDKGDLGPYIVPMGYATTGTIYSYLDLVTYVNDSFLCRTGHQLTSISQLNNSGLWQKIADGFDETDLTGVVFTTGNQNINGVKNFLQTPTVNSSYLTSTRITGSSSLSGINFSGSGIVNISLVNGNAVISTFQEFGRVKIPSGAKETGIFYTNTYSSIPSVINTTLEFTGVSGSFFSHYISNKNLTGFNVNFSADLDSPHYFINYAVIR